LVATTAPAPAHLAFFGLTAALAAFGCGIPAFVEKSLVFARKGEFLSAVAADELQIASHGSSFPLLLP
jgi:hypothetical protein